MYLIYKQYLRSTLSQNWSHYNVLWLIKVCVCVWFLYFFIKIFVYLVLAALSLCCCSQAFSSCSKQGLLSTLSSCGAQASHCCCFSCWGAQAPGAWASVVALHRLSCLLARGLPLDQRWHLNAPCGRVDSQPLDSREATCMWFLMSPNFSVLPLLYKTSNICPRWLWWELELGLRRHSVNRLVTLFLWLKPSAFALTAFLPSFFFPRETESSESLFGPKLNSLKG